MNLNAGALALMALVSALALSACGKGSGQAALLSRSSDQIIGGTDANGSEEFSKTIAALYNVSEGSLCTASILSDSILLTAAHCVDGPASNLRVVFGNDIGSRDRQIRKVDLYQVSPLWPLRQNEELNAGDIAVVRFSGGLPEGYHPTKILNSAEALKDGQTVLLAGFGQNNGVEGTGSGKLRYVEVEIENVKYTDTEVLLDQRHGRGACHGDSGGPAYVKINGEYALWGVTNRGVNDPNNNCSVSAAYASVPFWLSWVAKTATVLNARAATQPAPAPAPAPAPSGGGARVAGF